MKPLRRRDLIHKFRALGFDGPMGSGKHQFMQKGSLKVHIPGQHTQDVSIALQREILRQAGLSAEEWDRA